MLRQSRGRKVAAKAKPLTQAAPNRPPATICGRRPWVSEKRPITGLVREMTITYPESRTPTWEAARWCCTACRGRKVSKIP